MHPAAAQEKGRQAVRDAEAVPALIELLPSGDARVAARAAGAMHNLSSDPLSVRAIRRADGLAPLVTLLRCLPVHPMSTLLPAPHRRSCSQCASAVCAAAHTLAR